MEGIERFENYFEKKIFESWTEFFWCKEVCKDFTWTKNGTYKIPQTLYDNKVNEAIEKEYMEQKIVCTKTSPIKKRVDL
jgi:hypothetical protein